MLGNMTAAARKTADPTVYREEDAVGEHEIQTYILELLRPLVERYLRQRRVHAHVGSDQFIYWERFDPTCSIAPDLYVLPGVPQDIAIATWKVWEKKVVPSFVLEVVGTNPRKDYEEAPKLYAELGVQELVVFDPHRSTQRTVFQVYRRQQKGFRRVLSTDGDRVRSRVLGCVIRKVGDDAQTRLRLATGDRGETLFPTGEEAERAAKEAERAAKEAALARIAELEAQLARRSRRHR
jgi:Uma2 family endonuclease